MGRIENKFKFISNMVLHPICVAVKSRLKNIGKRHKNKLFNLHKQQQMNQSSNEKINNHIKSTIHNFSSKKKNF